MKVYLVGWIMKAKTDNSNLINKKLQTVIKKDKKCLFVKSYFIQQWHRQ